MSHPKKQYKARHSLEETASLLRFVAQALEDGRIAVGDMHMPLEADHAINVSFKLDPVKETFRLKLKYKGHAGGTGHERPSGPGSPLHRFGGGGSRAVSDQGSATGKLPGREPYKKLKKRMKKNFLAIAEALQAGMFPPEALCSRFIDDSMAMITYPGKGDPHYERYRRATEEFARNLEEKDMNGLVAAAKRIEAIKNGCHE